MIGEAVVAGLCGGCFGSAPCTACPSEMHFWSGQYVSVPSTVPRRPHCEELGRAARADVGQTLSCRGVWVPLTRGKVLAWRCGPRQQKAPHIAGDGHQKAAERRQVENAEEHQTCDSEDCHECFGRLRIDFESTSQAW